MTEAAHDDADHQPTPNDEPHAPALHALAARLGEIASTPFGKDAITEMQRVATGVRDVIGAMNAALLAEIAYAARRDTLRQIGRTIGNIPAQAKAEIVAADVVDDAADHPPRILTEITLTNNQVTGPSGTSALLPAEVVLLDIFLATEGEWLTFGDIKNRSLDRGANSEASLRRARKGLAHKLKTVAGDVDVIEYDRRGPSGAYRQRLNPAASIIGGEVADSPEEEPESESAPGKTDDSKTENPGPEIEPEPELPLVKFKEEGGNTIGDIVAYLAVAYPGRGFTPEQVIDIISGDRIITKTGKDPDRWRLSHFAASRTVEKLTGIKPAA